MRRASIYVSVILTFCFLILSSSFAATDGIYQLSEVTAAWDGTDADRTATSTTDYDYTYGNEASVTYTLPWAFSFYGNSYSTITADTNGNVWFTATNSANSYNLASTGRGPVIAAWNNDLSSYYYSGVFIQHKTNPDRVVIEWQTETYTDEGYNLTNNMEVVIFPNGAIRFDYNMFNGASLMDFGSGISKGDGTAYLSLTTNYGNVFTLAGRSFAVATPSPPPVVNPGNSLVNTSNVTLSGSMTEGTTVSVTANTTAVIGAITYPSSTNWNCAVSGLVEGDNNFTITATNQWGASAGVLKTVTKDTIPPTVLLSSPTGVINNKTPLLAYTVSDGIVVVKLDGAVINKISDQTLYALADGTHTLVVQSTDAAGNTGSASVTFAVLTVPPTLTVNQVDTPTNVVNQTLAGNVGAGAVVTISGTPGASVGIISYPTSATWSCQVTLAPGTNTFTITATDQAGNKSNASVSIVFTPPLSVTLSPATITSGNQGGVVLSIKNITTAGSGVFVEQFVDANQNGVIDAGDCVIRSFKLTDGSASANPNVQGDEDGAANSAIVSTLNYSLLNDLYHAPGQYIFRVTSGNNVATVPFTVTAVNQPQSIAGIVTANSVPVPGAFIQLADNWSRTVAFTLADANGLYTINVPNAGNYLVTPLAYGYVAGMARTPVSVTAGQTVTGNNLIMTPGVFQVTGQLIDSSTGTGIDGVWIKATNSTANGVAISGSDGSYGLLLPAGSYVITPTADPTLPNPSAKGYLGFNNLTTNINVTADISGTTLPLPQGNSLISGTVSTGQGNQVQGIPVQGMIPASSDPRVPVVYGVTNADGNYALAITTGNNWNIALQDSSAQILCYIGTSIGNYSTTNNSPTGNDLTAYPITAWVQGTVTDSNNNLVAGADMWLRNGDSSILSMLATAIDGAYWMGTFAGNWWIDDVTHNKGNQTLEQAVTLADAQTVTADFVVDVTTPTLSINPVTSPTAVNPCSAACCG